MFRFSLKGPRAHIFFAEDDSSQSRNVLNYVIITNYLIFFQLDCRTFSNHGLSNISLMDFNWIVKKIFFNVAGLSK